jgi:hypothetical protein
MPLRDHFRPPVSKRSSWEGFHAMWPAYMVERLMEILPAGFIAEPRVRLGNSYEIDVGAFEDFSDPEPSGGEYGSTADTPGPASWVAPAPGLMVETEFESQYAYEVLILDADRERELVAAVELVSPGNKDRPDARQLFVAKCATLLSKGVCVAIVDLVTVRHFNLYVELLALKEQSDPAFTPDPPSTYAATCRPRVVRRKPRLETWSYPMVVGQPLPILPLWLAPNRSVSLDLEVSYEKTCRVMQLP